MTLKATTKLTLAHKVCNLFCARPNEWIDGRELMQVGGYAAWRTRISECRRKYHMRIDNEVIRHEDYTVSRYRYRPERLF